MLQDKTGAISYSTKRDDDGHRDEYKDGHENVELVVGAGGVGKSQKSCIQRLGRASWSRGSMLVV